MTGLADPLALASARPLPPGPAPRLVHLQYSSGPYESYMLVHEPPPGRAHRLPVVYLHGIQSHPAWFAASAAHLAGQGHPVFQPARRGSGANARDRGHLASAAQAIQDVDDAIDLACREYSAPRVHLAGVSWGGKLAAAFAVRKGGCDRLASLTLVAPGIAARVDVPAGVKLRIALCLLGAPRRLFDIPLNEPELFTDNPDLRRWLAADPLRLRKATARFLFVSRRLDSMLTRAARGCLSIPTTLMLADRDRIIDNPRTEDLLSRLTGGGVRVLRFDAAHTLEFEPDPSAFLAALAASL